MNSTPTTILHSSHPLPNDHFDRYGLFKDAAIEDRYVRDDWQTLSVRLRLAGGLGGVAFVTGSVIDWSVLHDTTAYWLLLMLRCIVLAMGLLLVQSARPRHAAPRKRLARILLSFELAAIVVYTIVLLTYTHYTASQTLTTIFIAMAFYVFVPTLRPANLWVLPTAALLHLIELITVIHASRHDVVLFLIFVSFTNALGWIIAVKNNITQRQSWLTQVRYSQANTFYQAMTSIESVLLSARSISDIFSGVVKEMYRTELFAFSAISTPNASGHLRYQYSQGHDVHIILQQEQSQPDTTVTQHFAELAFTTNRLLVIDDLYAEQHAIPQANDANSIIYLALHKLNIQSIAFFPICSQNMIHGLIVLSSHHHHAFDLDMEHLVQQLTDLIGMAFDKLLLQEQLAQKNREDVYLAQHDRLTGLANRLALERHLPAALIRAQRSGQYIAVCMLDLDDFKPINDQYGHEAGDELLKQLSQRMRDLVRQSDFIARLGGDEFVIILEDLTPESWLAEMTQALSRFHIAVETPFALATGQQSEVGMTLGAALFPRDGDTADTLLRQADAAMYQIKQRKLDRTKWWSIGVIDGNDVQIEESFDTYSTAAIILLHKYQPWLHAAIDEYITSLYANDNQHNEITRILPHLSEDEQTHLRQQQHAQLAFLLSPDTPRQAIIQRAKHLGQIHALVGLSTDTLVQLLGEFRALLQKTIQNTPMIARNKYQLLLAAEDRLQEDMLNQLQAMETTIALYHTPISKPMPPNGSLWVDVERAELEKLGDLPGVLDIAVMIPDENGVFQIANSEPSGHNAKLIRQVTLSMPQPTVDPHLPTGNATVSMAWRSRNIQTIPSYMLNPNMHVWHAQFKLLGIRSVLAIPILDRQSRPVAVLRFFGAYPNQFQSTWMQQIALTLRRRWEDIWSRCATTPMQNVIPAQLAQTYRKQLFSGGLQMFMQPIVDLHEGTVNKVEALARISLPNGETISPTLFSFLLGDAELDYVFRRAIDQSLRWLTEWDNAGLSLNIAVNLPPSTLEDPDCHRWISAALQRYQITPDRLSLEILESQVLDRPQQHKNIRQLVDMGVKLSMDDLGTGYSSLQRLAELPFDIIKVDQALLTHIRRDPKNTLIVIRTLLRLGRDLGRDVIIEGLEDASMIEAVVQLGARYGQGYGLARPMPAGEIAVWMTSFAFAPRPHPIQTHLGALAYHLTWLEHGGHHISPVKTCPISEFLSADPDKNRNAIQWHEALHHDVNTEHYSQQLMHWLVEQIQIQIQPTI